MVKEIEPNLRKKIIAAPLDILLNGMNGLQFAASIGEIDLVNEMLSNIMHNPDIDTLTQKCHQTPLYIAAASQQYTVVEALLLAGANIEQGWKKNGTTSSVKDLASKNKRLQESIDKVKKQTKREQTRINSLDEWYIRITSGIKDNDTKNKYVTQATITEPDFIRAIKCIGRRTSLDMVTEIFAVPHDPFDKEKILKAIDLCLLPGYGGGVGEDVKKYLEGKKQEITTLMRKNDLNLEEKKPKEQKAPLATVAEEPAALYR
jgi:outer membrane murein-binding lipoprotein Lpp